MPDSLSIDINRLRINEHTKIITQTDLNSYITGLDLKGHYSLQQQSMLYQLLHTDSPTLEQFKNLSPFIGPEDFKIIIRKLPEDKIPPDVLNIHHNLDMQTWNQITKFLTFSDIAAKRASATKMFHGDIGDSLAKLRPH